MENTIYTLRKIHPDTWSGIRLFVNSTEDIGPGIDDQGLPITGLTENYSQENSKGNKEIVKGTRELLEEAMGLEPGTLKKGSVQKPGEFWLKYSVKIGQGDERFDMSIPDDRLKIEFLKAQPQVAFGVKNIKAKSEYVLFTKEEEAKKSNEAKKGKREAYKLFDELTLQDKKEILETTGIKAAGLSSDLIDDKLSDFVEEYPAKFIALAKDPSRKDKTFVRECLDKGILSLEGGAVMYNELVLGYDVESAASKLFSDEEAKTRKAIEMQLKGNK